MGWIFIYLLMMLKYTNLKQKNLRNCSSIISGNASKDFSVDNKKRLDNANMSMIFQLIMIVMMLQIFWTFINIQWKKRHKIISEVI